MKKRVIVPLVFLFLIFSVYGYYCESEDYDYKVHENKLYFKTFHITHDDGRSYDRTFFNYNEYRNGYDICKTDFERKGIYLDYFDRRDAIRLETREFFEMKSNYFNCPEGWVCFHDNIR
jgi:hypothetical protein